MKRKTFTWLFGGLLFLGVALWYRSCSGTVRVGSQSAVLIKPQNMPTQSTNPVGKNSTTIISRDQIKEAIEKERVYEAKIWNFGFATPIRFYGKVVDETGESVAGAKARISMHNSGINNTKVEKVTDATGLFFVSGHGLGLGVMVSKPGYYHLPESDGSFGYAQGAGTGAPHPNSNNPAIFVLRKMGQTESLFSFQSYFKVLKNGTPCAVDLSTGQRTSKNSEREIIVEAWTQDSDLRPYDWKCRITAPGGGLLERIGNFDFIAPESGYVSGVEINMPSNLGKDWHAQVSKNYFIKFGSDNYARVDFTMIAEGDHFFSLTSYVNPKHGHRNLEFDAAKQLEAFSSE